MTKRIALISEHASPLADLGSVDSGGQNVYVAQVAVHLARQGYLVDVFTRRDDESLPEIQEWKDGVRVIHVSAGPATYVRKEELLPFMEDFANFVIQFTNLQESPYDLIHANFWMSALVAADIKRTLGIPFAVTFHALGRVRRLHQGKEDGFPDVRFVIEDRVVAEADSIIAECPQDKHDLLCLYQADPTKVSVIPCGFDTAEVWPMDKALSRQVLGLPKDEPVILQLGRMVPRKGVDTVIRGFARLVKEHGIKARLIVVGGESEEPDPELTPEIGRLQTVAEEEGVSDRVIFTGRRGRKAIKHFYSAADVFISTPWYEPFGITPVEAMACGTPVIGSNVGGIKFTIRDGETGFLVPPNDPDVLAERLAYLYQNPDKLELFSQQALQRANDFFTWEKVATSIAELFERVIAAAQGTATSQKFEDISEVVSGIRSEVMSKGMNGVLVESVSLPALGEAEVDSEALAHQKAAIEKSFDSALQVMHASRQVLSTSILEASQAIINCLSQGGKVLVCGNGGSAADAQHFAAEFVGRFIYPERKGLPVMALTADTAFLTAWANDVAFDQVFSRQVETYGQPGDFLVGISTSGRSENLVAAFNTAHSLGMGCIALLGGDGGNVLPLADVAVMVPSANTQRIQEVQSFILHMICELVEEHLVQTSSLLSSSSNKERSAWELHGGIPVQLHRTK